jgi:2,3-bisphosphoglycerate-dependent phosphoglycerate mutase
VPPPGGESIKMVEKRVYSFIKDLLKFMKKNKVNVGISAHGNSMRPFRRYFEGFSVKKMMSLEMPYDTYFEYKIRC